MDNKLLRSGIIEKLKMYDAYIDNELPDYIMVMIANGKTIHQINNDLNLFLADNADKFTAWLQDVLSNPALLKPSQNEVSPVAGSKRAHGGHSDIQTSKSAKVTPESKSSKSKDSRSVVHQKPPSSRDQDLRSLIRRRRAGDRISEPIRADSESDEDVDTSNRVGVASVVRLPERQPRSKGAGGTGRLLQRAIQGIHGVGTSKRSSVTSSHKSVKKSNERTHHKRKHAGASDTQSDVNLQEEEFVDEFREEQVNLAPVMVETSEDEEEEEEEEEGRRKEEKNKEETKQPETQKDTAPEVLLSDQLEAAMVAAVKKVLPRAQKDTVDLREVLNKSKQKEGTKFVVTMEGLGDKYSYVDSLPSGDQLQDEGGLEEVSVSGMPERCKFWPNCRNGDSCSFHHPKTPCRLFPNCKYGNKCCFIHPACKFDGRCTRQDCPYMHTVKRPRIMPTLGMPIVPVPGLIGSTGPYTYPTSGSARSKRYPKKSALTWSPAGRGQSVSERKFAVADDQTTSLPVQ